METQQTISAWRAETFNDHDTPGRIVARGVMELGELLATIARGDQPGIRIAEEAADVAIPMLHLAQMQGVEVDFRRRSTIVHPTPDNAMHYAVLAMSSLARLSLVVADIASASPATHIAELFRSLENVCFCTDHLLADAIDAKMGINRTRIWQKNEASGHGFHLHADEPQPALEPLPEDVMRVKIVLLPHLAALDGPMVAYVEGNALEVNGHVVADRIDEDALPLLNQICARANAFTTAVKVLDTAEPVVSVPKPAIMEALGFYAETDWSKLDDDLDHSSGSARPGRRARQVLGLPVVTAEDLERQEPPPPPPPETAERQPVEAMGEQQQD